MSSRETVRATLPATIPSSQGSALAGPPWFAYSSHCSWKRWVEDKLVHCLPHQPLPFHRKENPTRGGLVLTPKVHKGLAKCRDC